MLKKNFLYINNHLTSNSLLFFPSLSIYLIMPPVISINPIQTVNLHQHIKGEPPHTQELSPSSRDSTVSSSSSSGNSSVYDHVLNHSHLRPGRDASLLSYAQTINMYRENAKKTHNADTECDLAIFLIQVANKQEADKKEYLLEAEKILKQLSIKGHANAQYQLGQLFAAGVLSKKGKPELDKAFSLFVQAAKHFHADASNRYVETIQKKIVGKFS
jgi:TPR repeat protein